MRGRLEVDKENASIHHKIYAGVLRFNGSPCFVDFDNNWHTAVVSTHAFEPDMVVFATLLEPWTFPDVNHTVFNWKRCATYYGQFSYYDGKAATNTTVIVDHDTPEDMPRITEIMAETLLIMGFLFAMLVWAHVGFHVVHRVIQEYKEYRRGRVAVQSV